MKKWCDMGTYAFHTMEITMYDKDIADSLYRWSRRKRYFNHWHPIPLPWKIDSMILGDYLNHKNTQSQAQSRFPGNNGTTSFNIPTWHPNMAAVTLLNTKDNRRRFT
ncbi:hypothetical protein KP79_PYT08958 [Mizuhopecten yessoensis]|uniref:Uncharacterized protein n=1 Tax=Mizuhopecten yessoensis TaxID=6573 RepID=A0A210PQ20_MIZYE|nr:hypothetical protein KP79_PYT08958 [Mizuhopecten yessoensis]